MTQLPGVAGEIEEVIGLEAAVRLLRARGGTSVEIPTTAENTYLAGLIGTEATALLIRHFGHGRVTLPCAALRGAEAERLRRKDLALRMLRDGASQREAALACDLHLRTVQRYAAELAQDRAQLTFGF